jgi:hypothetical protein
MKSSGVSIRLGRGYVIGPGWSSSLQPLTRHLAQRAGPGPGVVYRVNPTEAGLRMCLLVRLSGQLPD